MPIRPRTVPRPAVRPTPHRHESRRLSERPLLFNFDPGLSRTERDQRRTQWVVLITVIVLAVALLAGGIGYYVNGIRQPSLPVATVNGHAIRRDTWQHYQALLGAEVQGRAQQLQASRPALTDAAAIAQQQAELSSLQQELGQIPDQSVTELINAQLVAAALPALEKQGAPAGQLVASDQQITAALDKEKQTLAAGTGQSYADALKASGFNDLQLRDILATRLEEDNVKAYLSHDLKPVQPQVAARVMSFGDAAKAADALKALRGGKSWEDVNVQFSKDAPAKETSRDVAWTPKGQESATFDTFAFAAQPLQVSDVLTDNGQSEIIQVTNVGPARPLTANQISQIKDKSYTDWLNKQTASAKVQRFPQNMGV